MPARRARSETSPPCPEIAEASAPSAASPAPGAKRRAAAALRSSVPVRLVDRASPRNRAQLAAVAHERPRDPLGRMEHLVGEAALVAEPAVVHLGVVAMEHAHDLGVVADREGHVALARAEGADRAGVL